MLKGFRDFILRGNIIDLAVAVVIGQAFSQIVNALVRDIITPLIGLLGGQPDFSNVVFSIAQTKFLVGDFLNALISFLIMSAVIYFLIVAPMNRIMHKLKPKAKSEVMEKTCPECLSVIPAKAKRCKFCGTMQTTQAE